MKIIRWPRHIRYNCPPGCSRCEIDACPTQVLFLCRVCGGAEGDLPTECPGRRMHEDERAAVMNQHLDYVGGGWVPISAEARRPLTCE